MKRFLILICLLLAGNLLFAEMLYNREFEGDFLRYSYTVRDSKDSYMICARESRPNSLNNYNYFEITTTNEEKSEQFLLLMSECEYYEDFINDYLAKNQDLVFIRKTISISYENAITVSFYYELK